MHEVFLQRMAAHPVLRSDVNFKVFLEYEPEVLFTVLSTVCCVMLCIAWTILSQDVCPSVCLSVCRPQCDAVSKQLNVLWLFSH